MSSDRGFEESVLARGPALVRFTHGLSGDRGLGQDLCQEVLVKVHRRWARVHTDPERYVKRAIVRELISWRRRRSAHERPGHVSDRAVEGVEDALGDRDAVWRLLVRLPAKQRCVLVLRYWEGMSDREIAGLMDCAEGTVRSTAARAFSALREEPELAGLAVPAEARRQA